MEITTLKAKKIGHYNYKVCAECKGNCCKTCSGAFIPSDFNKEITFEFLDNLLKDDKTSIDWWIASPDIYYLRPRHIDEGIVCGSWGGVCVYHNENDGCELLEGDRPYGCRILKPKNGDNGCETLEEDKGDKYGCAEKWIKYQHILIEIVNKYS